MSETPDIRIVVGADLVKTKSVVGEDLQYISKQINAGKPIANVAIGLDVNGTRKLFEEKLKLITKDIKVDGIKLDLSKAIDNKPLDLKINSKNISDQVSNSISNATKNMKITLPKVESSTKDKKISSIDVTIGKYKKLGEITKENQNEVNKLRQAIIVAEDTATFKNATDNFDIFINKIKLAKVEMKKFDKVSDLKDTGRMYVSSRSKSDTIKNLENQFLAKDAGAKVSIKGTDYIDGDIKAYKELSATVTYSTGEVKKFNFEQAKIGKDIGYIESSGHTIKSVVDGNLKQLDRQKEAVRSMYDELSETNGNDKQVQSLFTKHQGLGVDGLQYTEKIKELQNVYLTVQKAFASKPSNVSENDWFDQNYEKIEGLKVGLKDLLPLFDVAKKELSTSLAITDTSRIGDTKAIKAKNEILDLIHTTEKYRQTNDRLDSNIGLSSGFDNFIAKLRELSNAENISEKEAKELNQEFKRLKNTTQEMGLEGQTFGTRVASQMQKFGVYLTGAGIMYGVWNQIKKMTTSVVELDTAMTELKKVTDETDNTYTNFLDNAETRAKRLGATLTDTVTATADFARLGFNLKESESIADSAIVYKNVGDGISDISTASESVISTMKAFKVEASDTMSIVDKFNNIGNKFAISSSGVGEALKRSASALSVAGNDIDESIALIVGGNAVVQDPEVVGTALKTAALRLTSTKGKLEELGEESEGAAESITKLQTQLLNLSKGKVDIMIDKDNFKSTYDILLGMSDVWDSMTQKDKMSSLEIMFGKRSVNVGASIIENMAEAKRALEESRGSAGSAMEENEKYLDSINGKVAQFKTSFQALSNTIVNSDLIKGVIDGGTVVLDILNKIVSVLGSIPTLAASVSGALAFKNIGRTNSRPLFKISIIEYALLT